MRIVDAGARRPHDIGGHLCFAVVPFGHLLLTGGQPHDSATSAIIDL
jgi:hypothetical protein